MGAKIGRKLEVNQLVNTSTGVAIKIDHKAKRNDVKTDRSGRGKSSIWIQC